MSLHLFCVVCVVSFSLVLIICGILYVVYILIILITKLIVWIARRKSSEEKDSLSTDESKRSEMIRQKRLHKFEEIQKSEANENSLRNILGDLKMPEMPHIATNTNDKSRDDSEST